MTRRRPAFTLVEMMVAFALVLFIMVILSEAFAKSLQAFRDLKGIGDLEERLRGVATLLRRDLAADHFEGRRRLSDPVQAWGGTWPPREGFFRVAQRSASTFAEGDDPDGISSRRTAQPVLHFTVKLRGNERGDFFLTTISSPSTSRLFTQSSTFFNQPADARYQDPLPTPAPASATYRSQWAEVAYFLEPNGTTTGATQLYALYRSQFAVVADNRNVNVAYTAQLEQQHREMSCQRDVVTDRLYFNTPADLVGATYRYPRWADQQERRVPRRTFDPQVPGPRAATLLLTDVVSFDVRAYAPVAASETPEDFVETYFDTGAIVVSESRTVPHALQITLRVWDLKSQQTRQLTLIQDL